METILTSDLPLDYQSKTATIFCFNRIRCKKHTTLAFQSPLPSLVFKETIHKFKPILGFHCKAAPVLNLSHHIRYK